MKDLRMAVLFVLNIMQWMFLKNDWFWLICALWLILAIIVYFKDIKNK